MNKIVEDLAGQAFQYAADNADETGKGQLGVFAEKFAELIVRECATLAYDGPSGILEHFGVEE